MDTNPRPGRFALDESAEFKHVSAPLITAIRRDQMPEDLRDAFLPEDVILFCEPSHNCPCSALKRAQARRECAPLNSKCPWCMTDEVCGGLILILVALVCLRVVSIQHNETFTLHVFEYTMAVLWAMLVVLALVVVRLRYGTKAYNGVTYRCSQGIKLHFVYNLVRRILSPSSLILLQQARLNFRSFCRYYQFFINGQIGGPADQEVDSCVRQHAAEGTLSRTGLIEDGSRALLGLAPCQDIFTDFRCGCSQLRVVYRTYRDWKRWRLAAMVYERVQSREGTSLRHIDVDYHNYVNPLERLAGGGSHKWLMVDPRVFSSKLPSQPRTTHA
ncbi:hypothetical protein N8I77_011743 [Diaporthe amygdali]|uniref:Uncharacterized protein n=1 Tax=Phomopsis amygdali TaxID=1214568 RepID=A0AAD9VZZ6_PHOAM|nr:hypothetical protein N8I77_011743 [Diaporthe amygdali]